MVGKFHPLFKKFQGALQGQVALPWERALELLGEGMKVSNHCRRQLEEAEKKVELLLKKADGKFGAEPFQQEEE